MDIDRDSIGMRIHGIRKEKGLTLEEFGKVIDNAGKSTVSKWERGLTLPNNKRLKTIALLGDMSVFRLLHGSGAGYIFNNYEKIMTDEYAEIKNVISAEAIAYLGEKIESEITNPTDFEGIRRVLDKEYPSIKNRFINYVDGFLQRIAKHRIYRDPVIKKIVTEREINEDEFVETIKYIFDNADGLTFEQKIKFLSKIEDIDSSLSVIVDGEVNYFEDEVYVIKEEYLTGNINTLDLNNNWRNQGIYIDIIHYRNNEQILPLKYENFKILIRTSQENKCDLIYNSSDLLVYYFPNFKFDFLEEYFTDTTMIIIKNGDLLLGRLENSSTFKTKINNKDVSIELDNKSNIHYFPLLAVFY